jgi:GNAT superfamily N-acetyltransferase
MTPSGSPIQVRELSGNDTGQVLGLINHIQPGAPWNSAHLRWQYLEPQAGPAKLYGIEDSKGKLIAFYSAVAHRLKIAGQTIVARMVQDVMTHPDHRGRGYLHQLAEACLANILRSGEVGYTFPNRQSENSFRRTGWTELCQVPWREKAIVSSPVPSGHSSVFTEVDNFGAEISSIWNESDLVVGVCRDANYLNWRYSKPAKTYFRFVANAKDAVIVLKLYDEPKQRVLHICDLFTRADTRRLLPRLLTFCEAFGADRGASMLTAWLPEGHPYSEAFSHFGLGIRESDRYVFAHPGRNQLDEFTKARFWHLTQGDSDIY